MPDPVIEERLHAIVGPAHVRPASRGDSVCGISPSFVVEPANEQEFAAVLRCADAEGLAVVPRGGGTKLGWGNPPSRADLIVSTARLDRVIEHAWADMTATVQAGCMVSHLQETLAQHAQRLGVDVLWPARATIGGILATNDSGALRLRYGGLRDLIIGATVALADGTLAASGGRVVKNVAGYDLQKLMTGALGTLGVITRATFRLHPLPQHTRTLSIQLRSASEAQDLVLAMQDSQLPHSGLQVRLTRDTAPVIDVLLEGVEAGIASQETVIQEVARPAFASVASDGVWAAREELWTMDGGAIAKLSILPSDLATTLATIDRAIGQRAASWRGVLQATGIGLLRLDGQSDVLPSMLREMRLAVEAGTGSFVVLRQPAGVEQVEAWGNPGDALPLMRALKQQLDPHGTLNPGRFVGGI